MDPAAIVMMIVMLGLVWGGLAVSLAHLLKNPDETAGALGAEDARTGRTVPVGDPAR